jgi:Flp pilus assembly protein TadG
MRRLAQDKRCVAMLEFALLAPLFIIIFAGVSDIGNALYTWCKLEEALAAGANYAMIEYGSLADTALASNIATLTSTSNSGTEANTTVNVNDGATYTVTSGSGSASGSASSSCYCPSGTPTNNWNWGNAVNCGTPCSGSNYTAGKFVTITVSYNFTPFFPNFGFVSNGAITAGAAVQTQ